jgi:hypothetical protein
MTRRLAQTIRDQVQTRAKGRCEYCMLPAQASFYPHQVDHIIPAIHGGNDSLENLAWACFQCNTAKTNNVASYDYETGLLTPLYNPRKLVWDEHFVYRGGLLTTHTPIGRVTIRVLQINLPDLVLMRGILMQSNHWR